MLILKKTPVQKFSKKLASIKFSQLIVADLEKIEKINKRELKESYLLNSYIINLVSSWQTFIEELLEFAIIEVIAKTTDLNIKTIIKNNFDENLKKFNTPNAENIDKIFKSVVGIEKITSLLPDSSTIRKQIGDILEIRHSIAHKGYSISELSISDNFDKMKVLFKAAEELQNIVQKRLGI